MDHYRIAVGIMHLMNDSTLPKRRKRGVQSAKATPTRPHVEEDGTDANSPNMKRFSKARVPSAPLMSSYKKRPFSTVSSLSMSRSSRSTSTRALEKQDRVRIDVDDQGSTSKSCTPAVFSTISG